MRILVFGGAGYIGSHTALELIRAGEEARGSSYFPSEHTVYHPAFFSLCVRNSFLLHFFVRNSFFALSLRENCLVARCVRKLTYKVLVIQCIIIRRCIFGRFI